MIPPISSIAPIAVPDLTQVQSANPAAGGFQSVLQGIIGHVEQSQAQAQQATQALAAQRASLEFELFLQVRNKVTSAYQEIMRMQV
jgi:flagellar hook-basal body complex protein FliE